MKYTPLHDVHLALSARMAPFGGWDMPIQYAGIIDEHLHTRETVSIFDTCHMGEFYLDGPTACDDLENLVTCRIATLKPGRCRYGFLLDADGGVRDDLIVYRRDAASFMVVVNAGTCDDDAAWFQNHLSAGTTYANRSDETAKIDVQGPASTAALAPLTDISLEKLPYFGFAEGTCTDAPAIVSRTGYTGERGYEVYLPADHAITLWRRLLEDDRVKPAGLGARDTLRLEAGLPLYGHELVRSRTPVGSGFTFAIAADKDFIGGHAVREELENGPPAKLVGLALASRRAAREGQNVVLGEDIIGTVTSGSYAPSLGHAIALAYIDAAYADGLDECAVATPRASLPARTAPLPFYTGTARD